MSVLDEPSDRNRNPRRSMLQFSRYTVVAVGSAFVDWIIFMLFNWFGEPPIVAHMIGRIGGGLFSFGLNKVWSFGENPATTLIVSGRRFLLLYAFSYVVSVSLFAFFANGLELSKYVSKFLADGTGFCINFVVMKHYTFHDRTGPIGALIRRYTKR
jgi:putative flippase GtrA